MAPTIHVNCEDVEFSGKHVKFFSIQLTSVIGVDVVWTGIFGLEGGAGKKVIIIVAFRIDRSLVYTGWINKITYIGTIFKVYTVELVQSDIWIFWYPVTSDKNLWS